MVQYDHLSAWITVDGRTLDEYSQKFDDELSEISCWIPSQEGKEFELHFSDEAIHYNVCLYYYVDGSTVGGRSLADTAEPRNSISCAGVKLSSETERPFIFSKTRLMEVDATPQTPSAALGEIKVECWSIDVRDEVPLGQPELSAAHSVSGREEVDAMHVGVGNVRRTKSRLSHEVARRILLASFLFRYRPIEILQASGLAPIVPLDADALQRGISEPADVFPIDPRLEATFVDVALSPDVKNEEEFEHLDDSTLVPQKRSASPISLNAEYSDPNISDDEGDDEERIAVLEAELARLRKRARKAPPDEKQEDSDPEIALSSVP
ncbi:hypothetical protein CYLTODRAFT_421169 [Cylindrobasidium torrendii FP15055 ss-10]|uniref:DUF7918 domain-containing protein n=1 Tax=Cylindrobasidium torrendii FP15055 ss-10 TaxID=1314674 RepID=A0A0D7BH12_9AGAR|nr:hypothetical protein CYLTODRAFT_421169 [Cylindrobasidium torrendii FP15055 ss-10]